MPCCAFARNMQRGLGLAFLSQFAAFLVLAYLGRAAALTLSSLCIADHHVLPNCVALVPSINVAYWILVSAFALYAGYRRHQLRQRFRIEGSEACDYAAWLCCPMCALCQETRTLAHNRVEDGIWLGPANPGSGRPRGDPPHFLRAGQEAGAYYVPVPGRDRMPESRESSC